MLESKEVQEKIINILKESGPSLPIQIAKKMGMNSLFISAFLSELTSEKRIKTSNLKVGGSALYYIEGQEEKLTEYYNHLHPKEVEAYMLLKKDKVLKDSEQEPSIRVALRSIKDFAIGFRINEDIYWRFIGTSNDEVNNILNKGKKEEKENTENKQEEVKDQRLEPEKKKKEYESTENKQEEVKDQRLEPEKKKKEFEEIKTNEKEEKFDNPLIINEPEKKKKEKPKSEFVKKTIEFLNKNNFKIIEEKDYKAKEYNCITQINSDLGPILFLTQSKDKKTITESDLKKLLSNSQKIPLPALIISTGEISKKAKEYLKNYSSILKSKRIIQV